MLVDAEEALTETMNALSTLFRQNFPEEPYVDWDYGAAMQSREPYKAPTPACEEMRAFLHVNGLDWDSESAERDPEKAHRFERMFPLAYSGEHYSGCKNCCGAICSGEDQCKKYECSRYEYRYKNSLDHY